jgi:P27 family predicted phage terminase small subunit
MEADRQGIKDLKLLTRVDKGALSCYCLAWSRLLEAEKHLEAEGAVVDGRQDGKVKNPWATIANQAMDQIRKLGAEFGLTPSSRPPARSASQGTHPGGDCSGAGRERGRGQNYLHEFLPGFKKFKSRWKRGEPDQRKGVTPKMGD